MTEVMACNELVEIVTDYLDGALSPGELARVRDHLRSCDGCEAHVEQMRATVRVLRGEPDEQVPPQMADALADMFRSWASRR